MDTTAMPELLPLNRAARRLGVTARWLKAEADAGRIPHLRAESRYIFDMEAVARSLSEQIRSQPPIREADRA